MEKLLQIFQDFLIKIFKNKVIYEMITATIPIEWYQFFNGYQDIGINFNKYIYEYKYYKDPNRQGINQYLKDIGSNINLDKMLTYKKRSYSCM